MKRGFGVVALLALGWTLLPGGAPSLAPAAATTPAEYRPTPWPSPVQDPELYKARSQPGYEEVRKGYRPLKTSVTRGQRLFGEYCASCHGEQFPSLEVAHAPIAGRSPPDLRDPRNYRWGYSRRALFRTSKFGIPMTAMAAIAASDQELQDIVAYVLSTRYPAPRRKASPKS